MAKAKKSAAVIAAEELKIAKSKELTDAEALVKKLQQEVGDAYRAVIAAQISDDEKLPQCRMVSVERRTGKETNSGMVVILRKTPTGIIVVRRVGDMGCEYKFKPGSPYSGYSEVVKFNWYSHTRNELRDIPSEFLP